MEICFATYSNNQPRLRSGHKSKKGGKMSEKKNFVLVRDISDEDMEWIDETRQSLGGYISRSSFVLMLIKKAKKQQEKKDGVKQVD
jgi:hypothetical protein